MSILNKLTEGIVNRDLRQEGAALLSKWEKTGLLEGIGDAQKRQTMSRLLENQAKELLREASTMAGGDVEGFAAVAFPIVRRVFGGLIANDLVSVQPMSLPSGLIFFLDFTTSNNGAGLPRLGYGQTDSPLNTDAMEESLYGGGVKGMQITGGVDLSSVVETGFYALNNGYASPTGSVSTATTPVASGTFLGTDNDSNTVSKAARFDADLTSGSDQLYVCKVAPTTLVTTNGSSVNLDNLVTITVSSSAGVGQFLDSTGAGQTLTQLRRLTHLDSDGNINFVGVRSGGGGTLATDMASVDDTHTYHFPIQDNITNVGSRALGSVVGTDDWGLENNTAIPEIDIKVDSVSITAITKKLKAKWTPELGQDLNAYHNLDAEVELTSILSEQIALEIDREILNDLVAGAKAGTYYWARSPGLFVNRTTGTEIGASSAAPDFTGTVSEWYETLVETINDVSAQIHRKTLRGGANFLVTSPEVANILEFTSGFRANLTADADKGTVGAVKAGTVSKKWDVWVDPYFHRNLVLVGRRGNSFLESGYVYAPYVPLQVTPTIFGTEDFVPRKGVMTRYGKKMVRPDMYGLVVVRGLLGEAGATS